MNIRDIHIYGFGPFVDVKYSFDHDGIHVIYGKNEAGKSSLMAFIQAILFGFPKRNQKANRFVPKGGHTYGGNIRFSSSRYGDVTIERVKKSKAAGDVTVYLWDGTSGGEALLHQVLAGMEQGQFLGVYAFDAHGLQGVEEMGADELNRYVYDTSATGGVSLKEIEKGLTRKKEELFKPRGQNQTINRLLKSLDDIAQSEKQLTKQYEDYDTLVYKRMNHEERYEQLQEERRQLLEEERSLAKLEQLDPLIEQYDQYKSLKNETEDMDTFPENGLERLESVKERLLLLDVDLTEKKNEHERIENELANQKVTEEEEALKAKIETIREELGSYEAKKEQVNTFLNTLEDEIEKNQSLIRSLGDQVDEEQIDRIDIHTEDEQKYQSLKKDYEQAAYNLERLHEERQQCYDTLLTHERRIESLQQESLSEDRRQWLEAMVDFGENKDERIQELERKREQVAQKNQLNEKQSKSHKGFTYALVALAGVASFLSVWFFIQGQNGLALLFLVYSLVSFGGFSERRRSHQHKKMQIPEVNQEDHVRLRELEERLASFERLSYEDVKKQWDAEQQRVRMLEREEELYEDRCREYETINLRFERFETQMDTFHKQIIDWVKEKQLPVYEDLTVYDRVIQMVKTCQENKKSIERNKKQSESIGDELAQFEREVMHVLEKLNEPQDMSVRKALEKMYQFLHQYEEKKQTEVKLKERLNRLDEDIRLTKQKLKKWKQEQDVLFAEGKAEDEQQFRQLAKKWEQHRSVEEKLRTLKYEMERVYTDPQELEAASHSLRQGSIDFDKSKQKFQMRQKEIENKEREEMEAITECKQKIEALEKGKGEESLHGQRSLLETDLQEESKAWAVYLTAEHLLEKAKHIHERERQPLVIQKAQGYFEKMTNGRYTNVFVPIDEQRFVIERYDGVRFSPHELSRGTYEMLYLAVRFALIQSIHHDESWPVIIDDAFVNFDPNRRQNVWNMLQSFTDRQIFYFTCHPYVLEEGSWENQHDLQADFI
ncbi:AAA family ATPase [Texcoconibacillus texcoconensis]|uniref:Uncharacterized protein YhaN n=1 Tax=Texcoconibacillus texcoconensis TaxID=1095777 RepID=A0A840QPH6_9BACI|nr:AAA family ATPase [Texcoconibacillus texcoconensis]MBB5173248.1 uncharacterized protein YhaN [Texcoconibacillus texcoconensis]